MEGVTLSQVFDITDNLLDNINIDDFALDLCDLSDCQNYDPDDSKSILAFLKQDTPQPGTTECESFEREHTDCYPPFPVLKFEDDGMHVNHECSKTYGQLGTCYYHPNVPNGVVQSPNKSAFSSCAFATPEQNHELVQYTHDPSVVTSDFSLKDIKVHFRARSSDAFSSSQRNKNRPALIQDSGYSPEMSDSYETSKRAPHNAIEKRYRASINGKIDELRRIVAPNNNGDIKLNKSSVLRRAIDRIRELEEINSHLRSELSALRSLEHAVSCVSSNNSASSSDLHSLETSPLSFSQIGQDIDSGHGTIHPRPVSPSNLNSSSSLHQTHILTPCNQLVQSYSYGSLPTTNDSITKQINRSLDMGMSKHKLSVSDNQSFVRGTREFVAPADITSRGKLKISNSLINDNVSSKHLVQNCPAQIQCRYEMRGKRTGDGMDNVLSAPNKTPRHHAQQVPVVCQKVNNFISPIVPKEGKNNSVTINNNNNNSNDVHNNKGSIQSKFPTVCQLLCGDKEKFNSISDQTFAMHDTSQVFGVHPDASGVVARTTLCVVALCLISLNPVYIVQHSSSQSFLSTEQKVSTSRTLMSISTLENSQLNPWFVWLAYLVQWILALFLCIFACKTWSTKQTIAKQQASPQLAKSHWRQANICIAQSIWTIAHHHLKLCLLHMNSSDYHEMQQLLDSKSKMKCYIQWGWILIKLAMKLGHILLIGFPKWIWFCYLAKRCNLLLFKQCSSSEPEEDEVVQNTFITDNCSISVIEVRLRLLELQLYFDKTADRLSHNPSIARFCSYLDQLALGIHCTNDFLNTSILSVNKKSFKRSTCSGLSTNILFKQGIILGLFMQRKLGLHLVGSILIHMTIYLASLSDATTSLWSQRLATNPNLGSIVTASSFGSRGVIHQTGLYNHATLHLNDKFKMELREHITCYCLKTILYGQTVDVRNLTSYINLLFDLCTPPPSFLVDREITKSCESTEQISEFRWWAVQIKLLWQYRLCQDDNPIAQSAFLSKLKNQCALFKLCSESIDEPIDNNNNNNGNKSSSTTITTGDIVMPKSFFTRPYFGDLIKVFLLLPKLSLCADSGNNNNNELNSEQLACLRDIHNLLDQLMVACNSILEPQFDHPVSEFRTDEECMRFCFIVWISMFNNWFMDYLTVALANIKKHSSKGGDFSITKQNKCLTDFCTEIVRSFNSSLWYTSQLNDILHISKSSWISQRLPALEATHRLLVGACPTRTKLALLQSYHQNDKLFQFVAQSPVDRSNNTLEETNDREPDFTTMTIDNHNKRAFVADDQFAMFKQQGHNSVFTNTRSSYRNVVGIQSPGL